MAKYLPNPYSDDYQYIVLVDHVGDVFPGQDRLHSLIVAHRSYGSPFYGAICSYYTLDDARSLAVLLQQMPNVVQHICKWCHPTRSVPWLIRWDLRPIAPDTLVTPVSVGPEYL
jgi:hypothetical protein